MQNKAKEHKVHNLKEDDVVVDEGSGAHTVDSVIAPFMTLKQLISIKMPKKASYRISILSTSKDWSCQRRPLAIVAALLTTLSIAFLNDSFAASFSEKTTRIVKQFSPHLAAKLRPQLRLLSEDDHLLKESFIFVVDHAGFLSSYFQLVCYHYTFFSMLFHFLFYLQFGCMIIILFVLCMFLPHALSLVLWFSSCGLLTVLWALTFGLIATILHASFRTPNLKAQVNTFREEFCAIWRNYSQM